MFRKINLLAVFLIFSGVATFGQQSGVQIAPYGYLKFDATHDTSRTAFGDAAFWVMPETASGGDERELNFSARETRLGLNIIAPESRGIKTTGRFEVDFYEELTVPNKYVPRLRLAYIDLAWDNGWSLRFGQDWDTFTSFHPDTLDANALAFQGHPYMRHPQARLTKDFKLGENTNLTLKLAVQHGRNSSNIDGPPLGNDTQPDENAAGVPNFHGSVMLKPRLLTDRQSLFTFSGVYGREKVTGAENPITYESWLIHGAVQLPLTQRLTVQGMFWKGENLDNYYAGINQGIDALKGIEVASHGAWGQLVYNLTKSTRTSIGYGFEDPDDDTLSGDARVYTDRIFANFFYNVTERVVFGFEYASMRTDYAISKDMQNHRINFGVQYRF